MQVRTDIGTDFEDHARDPAILQAAIAKARRDLDIARDKIAQPEATDTDRGILARETGKLARLTMLQGDFDEAESLFRDVIAQWEAFVPPRRRAWALATLGLGKMLRRAGRWDDAQTVFFDLLRASEGDLELSVYQHFIHHHLGLNAFKRGDNATAQAMLGEALERRRAAGQRRLIEETQAVLDALKSHGPTP